MSDNQKKLLAEKISIMLLVFGEDESGEKIYNYVVVPANNAAALENAAQKGSFKLGDFGAVIKTGKGEPDFVTRRMMEKRYGFDHDFIKKLKLESE